jgi:hypothetical protein
MRLNLIFVLIDFLIILAYPFVFLLENYDNFWDLRDNSSTFQLTGDMPCHP